jgi:DNA-binding transcriptional regulator YiaG
MSDSPIVETTPNAPNATKPDTGSPPPDPDWKEEASKWKALSRKHEDNAKANAEAAKKLAEIEESQKTEAQKAADREAAEKARADAAELKALRYEVGVERKVPTHLIRYLSGTNREELEANADQLLVDFGAAEPGKPITGGRPKEALRAGASAITTPDPAQTINDRIREAARGRV